jgi:hypothetical protein
MRRLPIDPRPSGCGCQRNQKDASRLLSVGVLRIGHRQQGQGLQWQRSARNSNPLAAAVASATPVWHVNGVAEATPPLIGVIVLWLIPLADNLIA